MHQFERRVFPTSRCNVALAPAVERELMAARTPSPMLRSSIVPTSPIPRSASTELISFTPEKLSQQHDNVGPTETPLFSPFRSYQHKRSDEQRFLHAIAERRIGKPSPAPFVAETLPSPNCRSPNSRASFRGTRQDLSTGDDTLAHSFCMFIDQSLCRIFPPLPEKSSLKNVLAPQSALSPCVDSRDSAAVLLYTPHTSIDFDSIETPQKNKRTASPSRASTTKSCPVDSSVPSPVGRDGQRPLPISPFPEASAKVPHRAEFHKPDGLPFLLSRIRRHDIMQGPPFDPAKETVKRTDPPMTDDERFFETVDSTQKSLRQSLKFTIPKITDDVGGDVCETKASAKLFRTSVQNKKRIKAARRISIASTSTLGSQASSPINFVDLENSTKLTQDPTVAVFTPDEVFEATVASEKETRRARQQQERAPSQSPPRKSRTAVSFGELLAS